MLRDARPGADIDAAWSRGSVTTEWLAQTFRRERRERIAETTLVSATPHTATVFDDRSWLTSPAEVPVSYPDLPTVSRDAFAAVHDIWAQHATAHGAVPPETMREATIAAVREADGPVVAHWMQPHEPFLAPDAQLRGGRALETNVWKALAAGRLDADAVWQSYRATLRHALTHLDTVLNAVDADVLVTADHGNAFGEWGAYGHHFGWPQPAVRRVPWWVTAAEAVNGYEPRPVLDGGADADIEAQLSALGYR